MEQLISHAAELLILCFLIITFLQSGFDKVFNWTGTLQWLKGHFSASPLRGLVPILLVLLLLTELAAGLLCAIGVYGIVRGKGTQMALAGAIVSCLALLMLLFGQRLAKDYEGAKTVAVYFVPAVMLVYILQE